MARERKEQCLDFNCFYFQYSRCSTSVGLNWALILNLLSLLVLHKASWNGSFMKRDKGVTFKPVVQTLLNDIQALQNYLFIHKTVGNWITKIRIFLNTRCFSVRFLVGHFFNYFSCKTKPTIWIPDTKVLILSLHLKSGPKYKNKLKTRPLHLVFQ